MSLIGSDELRVSGVIRKSGRSNIMCLFIFICGRPRDKWPLTP